MTKQLCRKVNLKSGTYLGSSVGDCMLTRVVVESASDQFSGDQPELKVYSPTGVMSH